MRTVAAALLGLIGGLFLGIALEALIGAADDVLLGGPDQGIRVVSLPPILAAAGAIAGPLLDRRRD